MRATKVSWIDLFCGSEPAQVCVTVRRITAILTGNFKLLRRIIRKIGLSVKVQFLLSFNSFTFYNWGVGI